MLNFKRFTLLNLSLLCIHGSHAALYVQPECKNKASIDNISDMFRCGTVTGSARIRSFSFNNAFFNGQSQDTTSLGGFLTYKTSEYNHISAAVGLQGQQHILKGAHAIGGFDNDNIGLGEAYIQWQNNNTKITLGNQRLSIPFLGDYSSFRTQPWLYQAADFIYDNQSYFIHLNAFQKYKSYMGDEFTSDSRLNDNLYLKTIDGKSYNQNSDLTSSIGVGKTIKTDNSNLLLQTWFQNYQDITNIFYTQANYTLLNQPFQPELGVQYIQGVETGEAYLGNIDSKSIGFKLKLNFPNKIIVNSGLNYIKTSNYAWQKGRLVTPYSHQTTSDPYFAQPFFTSTQDIGPGIFYMIDTSTKYIDNLNLGLRLTYADIDKSYQNNNDMYEIMPYFIYNFSGKYKGLSISNFFGLQKEKNDKKGFLNSRLGINYNF